MTEELAQEIIDSTEIEADNEVFIADILKILILKNGEKVYTKNIITRRLKNE